MTPEIERALATPHAKRLIVCALRGHTAALATAAKKDAALGYPESGKAKHNDDDMIAEVILPAFLADQSALELDAGTELRAHVGTAVLRHLRMLKADIERHLIDEQDERADEAVVNMSNTLGHYVWKVVTMVAERAHHDGVTARSLAPSETIARVLNELAGITPDGVAE